MIHLLFVFLIGVSCNGYKLPSYMQKCDLHDLHAENVKYCSEQLTKLIKPYLKAGTPQLNIPPLAPLYLPKLSINTENNINIELTNVNVTDLHEFDFKALEVNSSYVKMNFFFKQIVIHGNYQIDSTNLQVPIGNTGSSEMTLSRFSTNVAFSFKPMQRNGNMHMELFNYVSDFQSGSIKWHFIGSATNQMCMKGNLDEMKDSLQPIVMHLINNVLFGVFSGVYKL